MLRTGRIPVVARRTAQSRTTKSRTPKTPAPRGLAAAAGAPPSVLLGRAEAAGFFTSAAVGALKLAILTGVEPGAKVEALRKLAYAPVPEAERGVLAVRALADESPAVRREAAVLLRGFGLDADAAGAMETLAEESPKRRVFAADLLAKTAPKLADAERTIVAAGLLGHLRRETDDDAAAAVLRALSALPDQMAGRPDFLETLVATLLPRLADRFDALAGPVRGLFRALGTDRSLAAILEAQAAPVADRRVRGFLLEIALELPADAERRRSLARAAVREIAGGIESDFSCRVLGDRLTELGATAAEALIDILSDAPAMQRPHLAQLLDRAAGARGVPAGLRERAGRKLADLWESGDRTLRIAILETDLGSGRGLSPALRKTLARDYATSRGDYALDRIQDLLHEATVRLGAGVLDVLADAVRGAEKPAAREEAARAIGEIVRRADRLPGRPSFRELADLLSKSASAPFVRALGEACAGPAADPGVIADAAGRFRAALAPAGSDPLLQTARMEALGWIAAGPRTPAALRADLLFLLTELIGAEPPGEMARERKTPEGLVLETGRTAMFHTHYLPILLQGTGRALAAEGLSAGIREGTLRSLLALWRQASAFRVVWSPGNVTALAEALAGIGASEAVSGEARLAVFRALAEGALNPPLVRLLGIVGRQGDDSAAFARAAGEALAKILALAGKSDFTDREDRQILALAAGGLAVRRRLGRDAAEGETLRHRAVALLADTLASDFPAGVGRAGEMAESKHVSQEDREMLGRRLGQMKSRL